MELDWLKRWNMYSPKSIAIKDGDTGREYSYSELFERALNGARYLKTKYQIQKGDRVAVLATNELEYVFLFFALQRLGAIMVPINFRLTEREILHILSDCEPKLVLCQDAYVNMIANLAKERGFAHLLLQGPDSFAAAVELSHEDSDDFAGEAADPAMILYTSGTTGAPKGAILTFSMLFWNSINTSLRLNISQSDCTVIFLPFFHTGGWNVLTTPFIHRGAKVVFLKKFDAEKILQLSEQEKATLLFGVPTTMDMMARSEAFTSADLSHVRYAIVGGEPMPLDLIQTWAAKGIPVRQGYGLTEFGPNVFSLNEEDALRKIGSIGFPNFYVEARIIDNDGRELGAGEIGELILRGPMMMQGYWHNPEATEATIRNGWLHTGDLVRRDEDGYYYVVGRKKDMFISGGENVYPPEVEQVLKMHPGVLEVAVIGIPDSKWGEVGQAFVVPKHNQLSIDDLQNHCLKNLAKFKIPKYFKLLESLPKGDSGKVLKRKLKEWAPTAQ